MCTPSMTMLIPSVMERSITASTPTLTVSTWSLKPIRISSSSGGGGMRSER